MWEVKQKIRTFSALLALLACTVAGAGAQAGQAVAIQWPQNSINMAQLQNLFSRYPGISQFSIQFPNNFNWNVTPSEIESLYSNYTQQAQALGYGSTYRMPNLSFSSLPGSAGLHAGRLSIPIQNAMDDMQGQVNSAINQLRFQVSSGSWMPYWLHNDIDAAEDRMMSAYDSLPPWLRNWIEIAWSYVVFAFDYLWQKAFG